MRVRTTIGGTGVPWPIHRIIGRQLLVEAVVGHSTITYGRLAGNALVPSFDDITPLTGLAVTNGFSYEIEIPTGALNDWAIFQCPAGFFVTSVFNTRAGIEVIEAWNDISDTSQQFLVLGPLIAEAEFSYRIRIS